MSGPSYGPTVPYAPGYTQSGYNGQPSGDGPMMASYPGGEHYPSGAPYPPPGTAYPYGAPYSSGAPYPPTAPPVYPGTGGNYPFDSKEYPQGGGYPYPPTGPSQPMGGTGFPSGGVFIAPRLSPQTDPYQRNPSSDEQQIMMSGDGQGNWAGNSFSDKRIRHAFIKKVYLILMTQLLVTVAFVAVFIFCEPIKQWVRHNSWFYWCSYAVFLVTYIILVCCDSVRRSWPTNFICLSIFTLAMSYMTGTISSTYDTGIVLIAVAITAVVCLAISIFAVQTKIDFTMCSGLIFVLAMVLVFFGLACMITFAVSGPNYILSCVYGAVAALIFSVFLIFDTQMIVGGKHRRCQLSPEEYIYGALQLYVDVVNLFILILGLVGKRD